MRETTLWAMTERDRVLFLSGLIVGDVVTVVGEGRCVVEEVVGAGAGPGYVLVRTQAGIARRVDRMTITGRWA